MAIYEKHDGTHEQLHTYDSELTLARTQRVFDCWKNDYHLNIIKAWVDVTENGQKVKTVNVDLIKVPDVE